MATTCVSDAVGGESSPLGSTVDAPGPDGRASRFAARHCLVCPAEDDAADRFLGIPELRRERRDGCPRSSAHIDLQDVRVWDARIRGPGSLSHDGREVEDVVRAQVIQDICLTVPEHVLRASLPQLKAKGPRPVAVPRPLEPNVVVGTTQEQRAVCAHPTLNVDRTPDVSPAVTVHDLVNTCHDRNITELCTLSYDKPDGNTQIYELVEA